jgi:phosphinothricin acetyltransferase
VRAYRDGDLTRVHAIYAHHVIKGRASFELEPPTPEEMRDRLTALREGGYPVLVAAPEDAVVGYAHAGPFRPRPAYRHTVEDSVYVDAAFAGHGLGAALLGALIADCAARGFRQMIGVLGDRNNLASIRLHENLGFRHAGLLEAVGFKHERWLDVVLMQRSLGSA